jgi:hypothetical protein
MRHERWTSDRRRTVAFFACAALASYLVRDVWRYSNEASDWTTGSEAEDWVAVELEPLREHGLTVVHNLKRDDGGNVDHVVRGPLPLSRSRRRAASTARSIAGKPPVTRSWELREPAETGLKADCAGPEDRRTRCLV